MFWYTEPRYGQWAKCDHLYRPSINRENIGDFYCTTMHIITKREQFVEDIRMNAKIGFSQCLQNFLEFFYFYFQSWQESCIDFVADKVTGWLRELDSIRGFNIAVCQNKDVSSFSVPPTFWIFKIYSFMFICQIRIGVFYIYEAKTSKCSDFLV